MTSLLLLCHFKHHFVFLFDLFCLGFLWWAGDLIFYIGQTSWATERERGCPALV